MKAAHSRRLRTGNAMARQQARLRVQVGFACAVYVVALLLVYRFAIAEAWGYLGYTWDNPNPVIVGGTGAAAIGVGLLMPISLLRPSIVVYWALYIIVIVPAMLVPGVALSENGLNFLPLQALMLVGFLAMGMIYRIPLLSVSPGGLPAKKFWALIACASFAAYALLANTFGLRFNIVGLTEVTSVRAEFRGLQEGAGGWTGYVIAMQANIINPLLLGYGLLRRKPALLGAAIVGQLFLYSVTGYKMVVLSSIWVAALVLVTHTKGRRYRFGQFLPVAAALLIAFSVALDNIFSSVAYGGILVRRLLLAPGLLTAYHWDFFGANPKALLAHSSLGGFVASRYDVPPSRVIAMHYGKNPEASFNANMWADGYANFGLLGLIIAPLLCAVLLYIFDSLARSLDIRVSMLLVAMPAFSLTNTALHTTFLSHGLALALLTAMLAPRGSLRPP